MKIVVDMNLPPNWVEELRREGFEATHWSMVGDPRASDLEIMAWARIHDRIVLTHDLDFGALLATTHAGGPSVIQLRARDVLAPTLRAQAISALRRFACDLESGALIVVDVARSRVRLLPIRR